MGTTKELDYVLTDTELARYAKALGHPARVAIIQLLLRRSSCVCGAIVDEIGLSQSTISQHLKELRGAGIIKGDIDGPRTCYCIDEANWRKARLLFSTFFSASVSSENCC